MFLCSVLLENFLKSVYKGSKTEEIKLEDFDKIKFGNDSNNSIRYVSNRNLTYSYTLTDLIKNIKDNDLKYISISGDNFIVRDKSNNQIEYRIVSMKDKEIVINEINSKFLLITSIIGLIINLVMIKLLHMNKSGKKTKK